MAKGFLGEIEGSGEGGEGAASYISWPVPFSLAMGGVH
jgi:hypothetical protein